MPLDELKGAIAQRGGYAYLLTVGPDGRSHCVAVNVDWLGDELAVAPGNRSRDNAAARPLVSLLWPSPTIGDFSLLVDATVTSTIGGSGDNRIAMAPTKAVLHRSKDAQRQGETSPCTSDCVPIFPGAD